MRKGAIALTVSASAISAILAVEGFRSKAHIPVKGDVPTIGYGTTTRPDGLPVQTGDQITEPAARQRAISDIKNIYQAGVQQCLGETLVYQHEFDALVDASYNLGIAAICKSGMVRNFKVGDYKAGCEYFLKYRFSQGKDCFLPENARVCGGIKKRREYEYRLCMGLI